MEFSQTITTSDIIAGIAALISILSIFVHIWLFRISESRSAESNRLASNANKTAEKALEMTKFEHKEKVMPKLTGTCTPFFEKDVGNAVLIIWNRSLGKAKITNIKSLLGNYEIKSLENKQINYPIILGFNNMERVKITFNDLPIRSTKDVDAVERVKILDENDRILEKFISRCIFPVYFKDEIDNEYITYLKYDKKSERFIGKTVGTIEEN